MNLSSGVAPVRTFLEEGMHVELEVMWQGLHRKSVQSNGACNSGFQAALEDAG